MVFLEKGPKTDSDSGDESGSDSDQGSMYMLSKGYERRWKRYKRVSEPVFDPFLELKS